MLVSDPTLSEIEPLAFIESKPQSQAGEKADRSLLNEGEQAQYVIIEQILANKSDNDPRMDTDLKVLSEPLKDEIRKFYRNLPLEERSSRGTLVFLLGRNINTEADLMFFEEVLDEPPCLSLKDCRVVDEDLAYEHGQLGVATTLSYPQLVAKDRLKHLLKSQTNEELKIRARRILDKYKKSQ